MQNLNNLIQDLKGKMRPVGDQYQGKIFEMWRESAQMWRESA